MLGVTAAALLTAPLTLVAGAVRDVVRGRSRLPTVRTLLFVFQYLLNDSVEILAAGPLWILAGFGARLDTGASRRRHEALQAWSIRILARRADQLLGLRLAGDLDAYAPELLPGPAIVICRHVSLFDASLPSLLYQRLGVHTRGVVMAELLADPGFDLLYQRVGSAFIARDNAPEAAERAAAVAAQLDKSCVAVIFPEGRLATPEARQHSLARLSDRAPERAERLSGLRHLAPPRPGGLGALLDAAPDADVVVINHAGLDRVPSVRDIARHAPLGLKVDIDVHRLPRSDVPADPEDQIRWLDDLWLNMDDWVEQRLAAT